MPSSISSIIRWKISGAHFRPKGSLSHLNLPMGVIKVVKNDYASSSSICRKPDFASKTEKTLALGIAETTSSMVRTG